MAERNVFHVTPSADGRWIARLNDEGETHLFTTREAALHEARESAPRVGAREVLIHRPDGSVAETVRLGGAAEEHAPTPSTAAIAGHPVHPMIIPFPIAFLIGVPIADVVFAVTQTAFWAEASFWLLVAGLVMGGVAALAGLIDFLTLKTVRRHRVGWWHLLANSGALALALVNLFVRIGDRAAAVLPSGLILSLVTAGLIVVGGWYGGELSYRHRIGVMR